MGFLSGFARPLATVVVAVALLGAVGGCWNPSKEDPAVQVGPSLPSSDPVDPTALETRVRSRISADSTLSEAEAAREVNEIAGSWLYQGGELRQIVERHRDHVLADDAAYAAIRLPPGGECEGWVPCYLHAATGPLMEFLEAFPTSDLTVRAVEEANEGWRTVLADHPNLSEATELYDPVEVRELLDRYEAAALRLEGPARSAALELVAELRARFVASGRRSSTAPTGARIPAFTARQYAEDFDALWRFVRQTYVYFDPKTHRWGSVPDRHRARLREVTTIREFVSLLESVMEELRDFHAHLNTNTASSPNLVPSGADLWGEWLEDRAVVMQVRPGSEAESAGILAGMEILTVDGLPVSEAVRARLGGPGAPATPRALQWGLNAVLAGRRTGLRRLGLGGDGVELAVALQPPRDGGGPGLLEHARIEGDIGYVRILNSLGDLDLVPAFDAALDSLRDTKGLVLDLRDTPGGGNTTVARGIMGRLIERPAPYQMHRIPDPAGSGGSDIPRVWVEWVTPRGPFPYTAPVVVLVSRWTGSMGEGVAIGLDGMRRAAVVGTRMAGLRGATYTSTLPNTGISFTVPGELLFHLDGMSREDFVPPISVELRGENPGTDAILRAGLEVLRQRIRE